MNEWINEWIWFLQSHLALGPEMVEEASGCTGCLLQGKDSLPKVPEYSQEQTLKADGTSAPGQGVGIYQSTLYYTYWIMIVNYYILFISLHWPMLLQAPDNLSQLCSAMC